MELNKIQAKNFLSYEQFELDLNKGLCLIEGWNHDENSSNGSGKSSLMNAISYSIYGELPNGIKVDEVINNKTKKQCEVKLDFKLNNKNYSIVRLRKPNDLYILEENKIIRGKDMTETQVIINNLIHTDFKTFINSIYLTQNNAIDFIALTDNEKQNILTKLMDLEVFDKAYDYITDKIKIIDSQIDLNTILLLNNSINSLHDELNNLKKSSDNFEEHKKEQIRDKEYNILLKNKEYCQISEENKQDKIEVKDYSSKINNINKKISIEYTINKQYQEVSNLLAISNNEIKNLMIKKDKIIKMNGGQCSECGQLITPEHLQKELDLILDKTKEIEIKKQELFNKYNNLKDILNIISNLKIEKQQLEIKEKEEQQNKNKIERLIEQRKYQLKIIEKDIDKYKEDIINIINQKNIYDDIIQLKEKEYRDLKNKLEDLDNKNKQLEKLNKKYVVLKNVYKNIKYYVFENIIDKLNREIKDYLNQLFNECIEIKIVTETKITKKETKQTFATHIIFNNEERSYNSLSNGECQRINLAVCFSLAKIISNRGYNSLNILFLDEILSKGLDEAGANKVVSLLEEMRREKNIFIIDHNEYVKSICDTVIKVEKRDGISRIL